MDKHVYVAYDFIGNDICQTLINLHSKYYQLIGKPADEHGRECLDLFDLCSYIKLDSRYDDSNDVKDLLGRLFMFASRLDEKAYVNYSQIVKWPTNSYQQSHLDFEYHDWASILYLNENFSGGSTVVANQTHLPEPGKIIMFQGNSIEHGVNLIEQGERYTVATWYKSRKL